VTAPTAIIAEDEPLLRAELRALLTRLWPELRIGSEVADGLQAIQAIDRLSPQIVFLDIQMPGASGLDVAEHVSGRCNVVFISAFEQHALAAFERGALDYVLKPLTAERVRRTVERLKERLREPPPDLHALVELLRGLASKQEREYVKWLTVPHGADLRVVTVEEICYLQAEDKYTNLFTANTTYLLNATLKQLKERLDPKMFWQVHRSTIINVRAIETIHRSFRGAMEVKLKTRPEWLAVSAAYAHLFRQN